MLRFDVPRVWSNVVRWEAFLTHVVCWLALLVSPWFLALTLAWGGVRGFFGHHRCPSHLLWKKAFTRWNVQGKLEDAGPKMFAAKVLFVVSAIALLLFLSGSGLWQVPATALLLFSLLEWAAGFCAACWAYGAWYRRFPPAGT
jgi:hypothetical protein